MYTMHLEHIHLRSPLQTLLNVTLPPSCTFKKEINSLFPISSICMGMYMESFLGTWEMTLLPAAALS